MPPSAFSTTIGRRSDRFITVGIDEETRDEIGPLPTGRGVLGELISHPGPLRIDDVSAHAHSYGFPAGHPPMTTFLGVPIVVAGEPFGNLYLTEKHGGEGFTEADEEAVVLLAAFTGVAIDHARRFTRSESRRVDLQHTVEALDASMQIARALGGETDVDAILQLVAKRGRALVSARTLLIEHRREGRLIVAVGAGELPSGLIGREVDPQDSVAGAAMRSGRTLRLEDEPNQARFERHGLGALGLHATRRPRRPARVSRASPTECSSRSTAPRAGRYSPTDDQRLLEAFAASAALAVATAESVTAERQSQRLAAAEEERARWARELHDETLQSLASLRLGLATALKSDDPAPAIAAARAAVAQLETDIENLRSLITDLRPAALDQLGAGTAISALADRARLSGLDVDVSIDLAFEEGREPTRHRPEVETAIYRITQEALTNARKHGASQRAIVEIAEDATSVRVTVRDDGRGFDPHERTDGFGLLGMQERAQLLGGTLEIDTTPGGGTTVTAVLPIGRRAEQTGFGPRLQPRARIRRLIRRASAHPAPSVVARSHWAA